MKVVMTLTTKLLELLKQTNCCFRGAVEEIDRRLLAGSTQQPTGAEHLGSILARSNKPHH